MQYCKIIDDHFVYKFRQNMAAMIDLACILQSISHYYCICIIIITFIKKAKHDRF